MRSTRGLWVVGLACVLAGLGCDDKSGAGTTASAAPKARVPLGGKCEKNEDCVDGHGCAENKTCQSYQTIECRKHGDTCKRDGLCTGKGKACIAGSDPDCQQSQICKKEGRCTAKDGKCSASVPACTRRYAVFSDTLRSSAASCSVRNAVLPPSMATSSEDAYPRSMVSRSPSVTIGGRLRPHASDLQGLRGGRDLFWGSRLIRPCALPLVALGRSWWR